MYPMKMSRAAGRALMEAQKAAAPSTTNRFLTEQDVFDMVLDGDSPFLKYGFVDLEHDDPPGGGSTTEFPVTYTTAFAAGSDRQIILVVDKGDGSDAENALVKEATNLVTGFTAVLDQVGGAGNTTRIHWIAVRAVLAAEKLALFA